MTDLIATLVILLIVGAAVFYIIRAKKKGAKCIGCPAGGSCSSKKGIDCSCGGNNNNNK